MKRTLITFFLLCFFGAEIASQSTTTIVRCDDPTYRCAGTTKVKCKLNASDPCSCGDPLNTTLDDGSFLLHDQLVVSSDPPGTPIPDGQFVILYNWEELLMSEDFLTAEGENIIQKELDEFNMSEDPDFQTEGFYLDEFIFGPAMGGVIVVDFWRRPGSTINFEIQYGEEDYDPINYPGHTNDSEPISFEFFCPVFNCNAIPTIGQWGLIILGLTLTTLGLVFVRHRKGIAEKIQ